MDEDVSEHVQRSTLGQRVTLFEIDLTEKGVGVVRLVQAAAQGEVGGVIAFGGEDYSPWPIELEGLQKSANGPLARPVLRIGNVAANGKSYIATLGDLRGAPVTILRTFKRFLDGESDANASATLPIERFLINRKVAESTKTLSVEYELISVLDQESAQLPRGVCLRDFCPLIYRTFNGSTFDYDPTDEACPYTGTDYFDVNGESVVAAADDAPSKRFQTCCKPRFGAGPYPFGGFPGMARSRSR